MSTSVTRSPSISTTSVTRSRVVPGTSVTIARDAPTSALNRLDLPTFGSPTIATCSPSRTSRPRRASPSSAARPRDQRVDRPRQRAGLDEVIALVGKIDRRLEPRDQIEQRRVDRPRSRGQRAFELIERRARLQRRHRVDQIGDRLGLHQIDPAVQKRAQRELAGLRQPRAARDRRARRSRAAPPGCRAR